MNALPGSTLRTAASFLFRGGVVFFLMAVLALNFLARSQAYVAGQPGRLLLQPATGTMTTGENFTVDIMFNTSGQAISGIASRVVFSGADLQAVSIEGNSALGSGWSFPITAVNSAGGQTQIDMMAINQSTTGYTASTNTKIATITFRAVSAFSNKAVTFDLTQSQMLRKSDAADILGGVTNGSYSATGGTVQPSPTPTPTPTPTPPPEEGVQTTPTPTPTIDTSAQTTPTPTADTTTQITSEDTGIGGGDTSTTGQVEVTQEVPTSGADPMTLIALSGAGVGLVGIGGYSFFKRKR